MNKEIAFSPFRISSVLHSHSPKYYASISGNEIEGYFYAFPYKEGCLVMLSVNGVKDERIHIRLINRHNKEDLFILSSYNEKAWSAFYTKEININQPYCYIICIVNNEEVAKGRIIHLSSV